MFERLRSGGSPYAKLKLNRAEESHVLHVLHGLKRKTACYHTVETKKGGVGTGNSACIANQTIFSPKQLSRIVIEKFIKMIDSENIECILGEVRTQS